MKQHEEDVLKECTSHQSCEEAVALTRTTRLYCPLLELESMSLLELDRT